MSWSFGLDEDDAFFQPSFDHPSFFERGSSFFQPDEEARTSPSAGLAPEPSQMLAHENAELRQTASSLRERFAQITSVNANLKSQLEECRSRFRSAIFAGFTTRK
jgi:hypothetical protein